MGTALPVNAGGAAGAAARVTLSSPQEPSPESPQTPPPPPCDSSPPEPGLYCHVPFCALACDYCGFYQKQPRAGDFDRYVATVERELRLCPPERPAATFFWGGGTPSLLPPEALTRLGTLFLEANHGHHPAEWTVEMTPATARPERLAALRALGVTRVSVGVQSFDEATLAALGRRHTRRQIFQALEWISAAGFPDVSLDLIFAIPGQDEARWHADLEQAIRLAPNHISTYCLTLEEDTALFLRLARANAAVAANTPPRAPYRPDATREADLYRATWAFLEQHGYAQYEISNFARPGHACLHNRNTWRMGEWLGYGPSAASQWRARRWRNPPDLDRWRAGVEAGAPAHEDIVNLTADSLFADSLIFGLRMNSGVCPAALAVRFGAAPPPPSLRALATALQSEGFLEIAPAHPALLNDAAAGNPCAIEFPASPPPSSSSPPRSSAAGETWRLTLEGRLRADAIAAAILEHF